MDEKTKPSLFSEERLADDDLSGEKEFAQKGLKDLAKEVLPLLIICALIGSGSVCAFVVLLLLKRAGS